jgi:hypothetical protein
VNSARFWEYLTNLMEIYCQQVIQVLEGHGQPSEFKM